MISTQVDAAALLGDPLRTRIVELLATEELCTCHLVTELDARQPTISHHLRVLREAGVVEVEPHGKFTYYRLRPEAVEELSARLAELASSARQARRRPC
ncbi:MAG: metalloregulator ArsR/SmtB family transcription factor [Candidatus Dormiibacterota bacterium]